MNLSKVATAASLCLLAGAGLFGQDRPEFKTECGLVRLDLQVEEQGRVLSGLRSADFVVYDEGEPQIPLYFDVQSEPLDLVLLLDFSGSMEGRSRQVVDSGLKALRMLGREDRIAVMAFAAKPRLLVPLCADEALLLNALHRLKSRIPAEDTDLYAGIDRATGLLSRGERQCRRAVLIITDNLGGIRHKEQRTLDVLTRTGAVVNALIFDSGIDARQHSMHAHLQQDVTRIADLTGGVSLTASEPREALTEAMALIRTRYSLYYRRPDAPSGAFHQVRVALAPALRQLHPGARVAVRPGYWLP